MADQSALLSTNRLGIFATAAIRLVTSTGALNSKRLSTGTVNADNTVTNLLAANLKQGFLDVYAMSSAGVTGLNIFADWSNSLSTGTFGTQMNTTQADDVYTARSETIRVTSSAFSTTGKKYALPVYGNSFRIRVQTVAGPGRFRIDGQFRV